MSKGKTLSKENSRPHSDIRRLKILLTEGSSIWSRELLFALGPYHTIDVADPSRFCQTRMSRFVRRYFRCPSFSESPKQYLSFIVDRLRHEQYDVLLPTHEQVYLLARFRDPLSDLVGLAVPRFNELQRVFCKAEFAKLLEELALPTPPTRIIHTHQELVRHDDFPCFVKVNIGTAGKGVRRATNRADLEAIAADFASAGWLQDESTLVIQQEVKGVQSVFFGVFQDGRLVAWHCVELSRPGAAGWAICGESAHHPTVIEQMSCLGRALNWHGALFIDYFYDPASQQPEYIECNPRIGAAHHAALAGVDLAGQFLRVSLGEPVQPLPAGRAGVRFHHGFLLLIALALEGANRRDLCRELWRRLRHQDTYANSRDTMTQPMQDWLSCLPAGFVTGLLLLRPKLAFSLVNKTVAKYSLPDAAARAIEDLPPDLIAE